MNNPFARVGCTGHSTLANATVLMTDYGVIVYPPDMAEIGQQRENLKFWQFRKRRELGQAWVRRFQEEKDKAKNAYLGKHSREVLWNNP